MLRSLTSAVSGLKNFTVMLDVLGDNLANIRTLGFKANRATFAEGLALRLRGAQQVGLGVNLSATDTDFTQGSLEFTGSPTDLAITGNSFFILNDGVRDRYTRAGNFFFNSERELVNPYGLTVQGWMADRVTGEINTILSPQKVVLKNEPSRAVATENAFLSGNLDATEVPKAQEMSSSQAFKIGAVLADGSTDLDALTVATLTSGVDTVVITGSKADGSSVSGTFTYGVDGTTLGELKDFIGALYAGSSTADIVDGKIVITDDLQDGNLVLGGDLPSETQTSISLAGTIDLPPFEITEEGFEGTRNISTTVFDSQGFAHNLVITFTNKGAGKWTWKAVIIGGDETALDPNSDEGTIQFSDTGQVIGFRGEAGAAPEITIIPDPQSTAARFTVQLDARGSESFAAVTQYAADYGLAVRDQDGRPMGTLLRFMIDEEGIITGIFSNDATETLAQIGLVEFNNPTGLLRSGDGLFDLTTSSGDARVGRAGETFTSSIISGSLEMSNVDLVRQFTDMITTQRSFQASARVVTTADQILEETMRLKR